MIVDVVFPVNGAQLPVHHGYQLYGGLSRVLPCLHDGSVKFGLGSITGRFIGRGMLRIDPRNSVMRLRLATNDIPRVLPLAGKAIAVNGDRVRLGVPHIEALNPSTDLMSRFVTVKHAEESDLFQAAARKKLDEIGVAGSVSIPAIPSIARNM